MSSQWDTVIGIDANNQFCGRIYDGRLFALKAIAYGKKGDYENALRMLPYFERIGGRPDIINYSGKVLQFIEGISDELNELVMETIKQAFAKAKGHAVPDNEFQQFHISFCEKELVRNWTEMDGERLIDYWQFKWCILSDKKKIPKSVMKKIAGSNSRLLKMTLGKRGFFISFIFGLVVGFGSALGIDWYSANQIEGLSMTLIAAIFAGLALVATFWLNVGTKESENYIGKWKASFMGSLVILAGFGIVALLDWVSSNVADLGRPPFIGMLFILIPICHALCRNRTNFFAIVMIALGVIGYLALAGVLNNEGLSLLKYIATFKEILQ